jgi:uncharacterized protein (TIGR02145 family)
MNATNSSTPSNRGYLYNWAAAVTKADAYNGSYQGCSGITTAANACQGICPAGWHIPTGNTAGEFYDLHYNYNRGCATNNSDCWNANSTWEGVLGGWCTNSGSLDEQGSRADYWSSTYCNASNAYLLIFFHNSTNPATETRHNKRDGRSVRCVRNY